MAALDAAIHAFAEPPPADPVFGFPIARSLFFKTKRFLYCDPAGKSWMAAYAGMTAGAVRELQRMA
jgi:hypothetical protein